MTYVNRIILFIFSVILPLSAHTVPTDPQPVLLSARKLTEVEQAARAWIDAYVTSLSYEEVQILANTIYLTYATSLLDVELKELTKKLLLATYQLHADVNTYDYEAMAVSDLPREVEKFQELRNTWIFIYKAWHACTSYTEHNNFKNMHYACSDALMAFSDYTKETVTQSSQYALIDLDTDIVALDNILKLSQNILARTHQGILPLTMTHDALEKTENTLQMAEILRKTGAHMVRFSIGLDSYTCNLIESVKMVSITYYKQLYQWMQFHEIPMQYMTLMFDADGIVAVERRTELLQDPKNLAYRSK